MRTLKAFDTDGAPVTLGTLGGKLFMNRSEVLQGVTIHRSRPGGKPMRLLEYPEAGEHHDGLSEVTLVEYDPGVDEGSTRIPEVERVVLDNNEKRFFAQDSHQGVTNVDLYVDGDPTHKRAMLKGQVEGSPTLYVREADDLVGKIVGIGRGSATQYFITGLDVADHIGAWARAILADPADLEVEDATGLGLLETVQPVPFVDESIPLAAERGQEYRAQRDRAVAETESLQYVISSVQRRVMEQAMQIHRMQNAISGVRASSAGFGASLIATPIVLSLINPGFPRALVFMLVMAGILTAIPSIMITVLLITWNPNGRDEFYDVEGLLGHTRTYSWWNLPFGYAFLTGAGRAKIVRRDEVSKIVNENYQAKRAAAMR